MAKPIPFGPLRPLLHVVLDRPRIFGNVAATTRLCANLGATLHVCGPFSPSWRGPMPSSASRPGLDYWDQVSISTHETLDRCLTFLGRAPVVVEVDGTGPYTAHAFSEGDVVVFGPEDGSVKTGLDAQARVYLPSTQAARSLNLSQCVAAVGYEALRQVDGLA